MPSYFVVHDAGGRIWQTIVSHAPAATFSAGLVVPAGYTLLETAELTAAATHYIAGGVPVARTSIIGSPDTSSILADGIDAATITGLPAPCTVEVAGPVSVAATTVAGGTLTLTASVPGIYQVRASKEPTHIPWLWSLTAT